MELACWILLETENQQMRSLAVEEAAQAEPQEAARRSPLAESLLPVQQPPLGQEGNVPGSTAAMVLVEKAGAWRPRPIFLLLKIKVPYGQLRLGLLALGQERRG